MEKNVEKFLHEATTIVSQDHAMVFYLDTEHEFKDLKIESPIEQLLYCALKTLREVNNLGNNDPVEIQGKIYIIGLGINPQQKIGKYRVDFLVTNYERDYKKTINKPVVVECDSQEWHERSEDERRYEKARDRYFQSKGYKVFHYTGKEITDDPFIVAKEILEFVCESEIIILE